MAGTHRQSDWRGEAGAKCFDSLVFTGSRDLYQVYNFADNSAGATLDAIELEKHATCSHEKQEPGEPGRRRVTAKEMESCLTHQAR